MTERLRQQLAALKKDITSLPDAVEPPSTTLQIIRSTQQEQDWQRLLFHYLNPNESHGLDHALLEHLLSALADRDDLAFSFSRLDLSDIEVAQEVTVSGGRRPDAVMWASEAWFICWELKIDATEGENQTRDYVAADSFEGIDVSKATLPDDGHHYVYLAPETASSPEAEEFVPISWEWIADQIQTFLAESHGEYPARTTAQLDTFVGTIQSEIMTTEYQENQQEKAELYFEYYNEITEAQEAFDNQWEWFANNWGSQLAEAMAGVDTVAIPALRDVDVAIQFTQPSLDDEQWVFRQGDSDWAGIFKQGWWRDEDDLSNIYTRDENRNDIRMTFFHRLEKNRDKAIRDRVLEVGLYHGVGIGDEFMYKFKEELTTGVDTSASEIPASVSVTGSRGNPLTVTYDIPVREHDDFFAAYVAALGDALQDLVVENRTLITLIEEAYEQSLVVFD